MSLSQSVMNQAMSTGNAEPTTLLRALVTCSKSDGASNSFPILSASSSEMGFLILHRCVAAHQTEQYWIHYC